MRQPAGPVCPLFLGQQAGRKHAETRGPAAIAGHVPPALAAQYRFERVAPEWSEAGRRQYSHVPSCPFVICMLSGYLVSPVSLPEWLRGWP